MSATAWTPGHVRYTEKLAIRLATEMVGEAPPEYWRKTVKAAHQLGFIGNGRRDLLRNLVGVLVLHRLPLTGTVRRALSK